MQSITNNNSQHRAVECLFVLPQAFMDACATSTGIEGPSRQLLLSWEASEKQAMVEIG